MNRLGWSLHLGKSLVMESADISAGAGSAADLLCGPGHVLRTISGPPALPHVQ